MSESKQHQPPMIIDEYKSVDIDTMGFVENWKNLLYKT